jgi:hypothetical protein
MKSLLLALMATAGYTRMLAAEHKLIIGDKFHPAETLVNSKIAPSHCILKSVTACTDKAEKMDFGVQLVSVTLTYINNPETLDVNQTYPADWCHPITANSSSFAPKDD